MPTEPTYKVDLFGIALDLKPEMVDTIPIALVKHEFPHQNGALLENMGQKPRTMRFTAVFKDDDYERHNDVFDLLSDNNESGEFVHPKYGVMIGQVEDLSVRHDSGKRKAELDFLFIEDLIGATEISIVDFDIKPPAEASYLKGVTDQVAKFNTDMQNDIATLGGLTTKLADYTNTVNILIAGFEGTMTAVANPANSLLSTINFATDLPGRVVGSLARVVERYSLAYEALKNAPTRFSSSLKASLAELDAATAKKTSAPRTQPQALAGATVMNHVKLASALRLGVETAYRLKEDQTGRNTITRNETVKSFDSVGNYTAPDAAPTVMNSGELEQVLSDARELLQSAVEPDRTQTALKDMADSLLRHVNTVKLDREKIIQIEVLSEIPLHILLLQRGRPYQEAERILLINNIKNPNAVKGLVNVYA